MSKQKIHFITYGDTQKYGISKKHILNLAKNSNIFNECIGYKKEDLDINFLNKYKKIFEASRGGGFYIWKQKIIFDHLQSMNQNDILFYSDAGSSFNPLGKKRFLEYIELLNLSEFGNLRFENKKKYIEKYWTIKELFDYFNIAMNSEEAQSTQLMGGHLMFKNNKHTNLFFENFFKTLEYDSLLVTDHYSENQIPGFLENRHDQSIMSIITKLIGGVILQNETFFEKGSEVQKDYPILSVRNYGHGLKDKIRYTFNVENKKNIPVFF
jgi:hypothetical protein